MKTNVKMPGFVAEDSAYPNGYRMALVDIHDCLKNVYPATEHGMNFTIKGVHWYCGEDPDNGYSFCYRW